MKQLHEMMAEFFERSLSEQLLRVCQRLRELPVAEGLEEIVDGVNSECLQRVLIVCGDENCERALVWQKFVHHFETAHLRHLYIEEQ
jgi:hypothetical protein